MGSQVRTRNIKPIAGAALVGLVLFILLGNTDVFAAPPSCPLETIAGQVLGVLPSFVLTAASQALQAYVLDHQGLSEGFFQMLVSFWSLLLVILGAVSVRAAFRGKVKAWRR
jgi:hypothetical protein